MSSSTDIASARRIIEESSARGGVALGVAAAEDGQALLADELRLEHAEILQPLGGVILRFCASMSTVGRSVRARYSERRATVTPYRE